MRNKQFLFVFLILLVACLPLSLVQSYNYTWKVRDSYTWEMRQGESVNLVSMYSNGTNSSVTAHREKVKILNIANADKKISVEKSYYSFSFYYYKRPVKVQEETISFDLFGNLYAMDINNLFTFHYYVDQITNKSYLTSISSSSKIGPDSFCFCSADWSAINENLQLLFNESTIIDTVNGIVFTFGDFLSNSTFSIMGESDYITALTKFSPTAHYWRATFDYSNLFLLSEYDNSCESFIANTTFILKYNTGGVLERFLIENTVILEFENQIRTDIEFKECTLINSRSTNYLLVIIVPSAVIIFIGTGTTLIIRRHKKKLKSQE